MSRKSLVVPQEQAALDQMKYEVAQQFGIQWSLDGYNGNMTTIMGLLVVTIQEH